MRNRVFYFRVRLPAAVYNKIDTPAGCIFFPQLLFKGRQSVKINRLFASVPGQVRNLAFVVRECPEVNGSKIFFWIAAAVPVSEKSQKIRQTNADIILQHFRIYRGMLKR